MHQALPTLSFARRPISSSHAPPGNSVADALRPELENTRNDIRNIIVPRDAERRDMHSHAERGNEVRGPNSAWSQWSGAA